MYHPWRKDEHGNPAIQFINPATVKSGKAAMMGYVPVPVIEAPPSPVPPVPTPNPKPTPAPVQKGGQDAD